MSKPLLSRLPLLLALALLGGCSSLTRTPYAPPVTQAPPAWQQAPAAGTVDAQRWWQGFGDAELTRLIDEVLRKNNNLAAATIKVRRAQLLAGLADDAFVPALGGQLGSSASKPLSGNNRSTTRQSQNSITLSYEVDLWGRLGANYDAARWEALATEQDRASTALTMVGTTANLYWTGAFLNQRIRTAEQSIDYARKTLELVNTQYGAGAVSSLEVLTAQQNLLSQQSSYTDLIRQRVENDNALAILFDSPPDQAFTLPPSLPEQPLPALEAGLPADLLGRRPDLRAAELRLRSALANVDLTRLGFYPQLNLTGTLGTSSDALLRLVQNPIATLGAQLTLPFLQQTQMKLKVGVSQADYDSAVTNFRQTLYSAFSDVENALAARQQYANQQALLVRNLEVAQAAERLFELRYRAGSVTLQAWLDQQDKRRTAETSLAQTRLNQLKNQMTLYQALGGDARATPPAMPAAQ
ncbi:efflux transporter outer membrane subunit [Herbaspirillum sp. AP02]|uniref:efflux transporter outer membrane subunit n=1 Tax=unclassified Herbaspirillum TaxID=2624150 RepID=UPI0015DB21A9|nr:MULTISPECIES: efflux transporter outer membrane subunit [unclassified Herbaspirillum]MBG7618425.1 efflux transporter outer membrane subunit [Herbaspirillum sp. AP02]NZD68585.1 efflux transporter outer membrane subunit [Herbaspirillum sp. AP21]